MWWLMLAVRVAVAWWWLGPGARADVEQEAAVFMARLNQQEAQMYNKLELASWAYTSNLTEHNLNIKLKAAVEHGIKEKELWKEAMTYPWRDFKDNNLRRQFKKISDIGASALPEDKLEKFEGILAEMEGIYGKAKVCSYKDPKKCDLSLEPELTEILQKSRDAEELKHVWLKWRDATGKKMREFYPKYVELINEASKLNNYSDTAARWIDDFECKKFEGDIERLWEEVKPLYQELHAFVRGRLRKHYGDKVVTGSKIPAHLLGNMWSQSWGHILDVTSPYPDKPSLDVTPLMVQQGYTPLKMVQMAEEFFKSLNWTALPESFWKLSIIEKPKDRELVCHASAWDFYDGKDFRIKMCTTVTQRDFETVHHELGHIYYFILYKDQPAVFRRGANSGFHEAVGDVMSLSVQTTSHLRSVGLLPAGEEQKHEDLVNQLFVSAMDKVAVLPFTYLMDQWRWSVFRGDIKPADYNAKWWELRHKYQGVEAPVPRSEEDFDPGAKYHIPANVPYVRYFVSHILQFQFHKALCKEAGYDENKPLSQCDIYKSVAAGNKLGSMLSLGGSKHWKDQLEQLTGSREMSADGLLEYYKPLYEWLKTENAKTGEKPGWDL